MLTGGRARLAHGLAKIAMTKGIILTTQRSGSTFIADCLQSHPEVFCPGEILQKGLGVELPDLIYRFRNLTKVSQFVMSGAWNSPRLMDRFFATGDAKAESLQGHVQPRRHPVDSSLP